LHLLILFKYAIYGSAQYIGKALQQRTSYRPNIKRILKKRHNGVFNVSFRQVLSQKSDHWCVNSNALAKLQGVGGQKIVVERVDVHQGGQAVVGNIQGGKGGND
jgi:hypothetical protein